MRRIEKGWGHELVWASGPGYTGKVLHFDRAGGKMSLHHHAKKHETWLCIHGSFTVVLVDPLTAVREELALCAEEHGTLEIRPGIDHQLIAQEADSAIVEVSTPDDPLDNFRVEPGDSQTGERYVPGK